MILGNFPAYTNNQVAEALQVSCLYKSWGYRNLGPQNFFALRAARGVDKKLIADVALFDLYAGEGVGEGKKSLAIAVRLEPSDRTLTDAEIETLATKLVDNVKKLTGGELRG